MHEKEMNGLGEKNAMLEDKHKNLKTQKTAKDSENLIYKSEITALKQSIETLK